jgi:hypothetical protein
MKSESLEHGTVMPSDCVSEIWKSWESDSKCKHTAQSSLGRAIFCDIAQHFPNGCVESFQYFLHRLDKEGLSFCLVTLPILGKAIEVSLVTLEDLIVPEGWTLCKHTRLPKFLYQLFSQLYDDDGRPRYSTSNRGEWNRSATLACLLLRQVCLMWSKVEVCTESGVVGTVCGSSQKAIDTFVARMSRDVEIHPEANFAIKEARRLLHHLFTFRSETLHELRGFQKKPWGRHGPGAVAGGECGPEKWSFYKWPGLPEDLFSVNEGLRLDAETQHSQPAARLCLVPKDFRGPRVICIEPKENQFAQQGLMDILYRHVRACPLTRRSIDFLDTVKSRSLCYDYHYATIDLKDASDLVSLQLCRLLLPRWIFKTLTRYRSRHVKLPNGSSVRSLCMATMGNATCFPIETIVFWALALGTMIKIRDSFAPRQRVHLNLDVRVFGDDIIVPLWAADAVCQVLDQVGMSVNKSKTCMFSPVRESCGEWIFMDTPVWIVKFHTTDITDGRSLCAWHDQLVECENQHSERNFLSALRIEISDHLHRKFNPLYRFNPRLQRLEVRVPQYVTEGRATCLDGVKGIYAHFVKNDVTPFLKGARKKCKMRWVDARTWMS